MPTIVPKEPALTALDDVWTRLGGLLGELSDDDWAAPTSLPGWTVKDVVAHLIGTESMLLGEPLPELDVSAAAHVRNDIGRFNERWVVSMADLTPVAVLARFRALTAQRLAALHEVDQATWDAEGFTPGGTDTYGRFMRIRTFDCWLHEQDIRDAVGRPGGEEGAAAEMALDEMAASMGFVVGKKAGAPPGSRVVFDLTGPAARCIFVEVGDHEGARATVVGELSGPPTVSLWMPEGVFARLGGGRVEPASLRDQVAIEGDVELGERIVSNLAYTI